VGAKTCDTTTETQTLAFQVHGDFFTDHVRSLMQEQNWMHALKSLSEGLVGIPLEACIEVLEGRSRLEGVNELDLVEEDPADPKVIEHKRQLNWCYSCIAKSPVPAKFEFYRPYAYVSNLGVVDLGADYGVIVNRRPNAKRKESGETNRASYYLQDRVNDITWYPRTACRSLDAYIKADKNVIAFLFEPCAPPPFWRRTNRDLIESVQEAARVGRTLWETGHEQTKATVDVEYADRFLDKSPAETVERSTSAIRSAASKLAENTGIPEAAVASMLGEGAEKYDETPETDTNCESKSGYILRDGRYFGCGYMGHYPLASSIFEHILEEDVAGSDVQQAADNRGWLRVQRNAMNDHTGFLLGSIKKKATKKQLKTVARYCDKHKCTFPNDLLQEY